MKKEHTKRFLELMQRDPNAEINGMLCFTDEEMEYLGKEDLSAFGDKFLGESYYYMNDLS